MTNWSSLTAHQKMGLGVFVVIGTATLIFSIFRLHKSIVLPFAHPAGSAFKTSDELEQEQQAKLKKTDTDSDTLTDYDELYIYRTSPFLSDSDSDGIQDGIEVNQSTDPNCPQGKSCEQVRSGSSPTPTTTGETVPSGQTTTGTQTASDAAITAAIQSTFGDPKTLTADAIKTKLGQMNSAELRAFLGKLGVPSTALQKTDDDTLRSLLQETLEQISSASGGTSQ